MERSNLLTRLLAAAMTALLLASCGGGGGSDSGGGGQPTVQAPSIQGQPAARTVNAGASVTFEVTASGTGTLTYQWQRNGVDIPGATQASYTIAQAAIGDDGARFSVKVGNAGGTVASDAATLTVNVAGSVTVQGGTFVPSVLSAGTVTSAGATLSVSDPNDPLAGARVVVPAGAVTQSVTVQLSSAPVTNTSGLPDGATVRSRLVRLDVKQASDGASVGELRKAVSITLPVSGSANDYVGFYKIDADGALEPMGTDASSTSPATLTFKTRAPGLAAAKVTRLSSARAQALGATPQALGPTLAYAAYVAVGVAQTTIAQLASTSSSIDTGFRPSNDGFYIPNYGSYYRDSRGGNCFGMVGFAKYYYQQGFSTRLATTYRDAAPTTAWVDDAVGIELASRVHNAMADIWDDYVSQELAQQTSASAVARSLIGALYVTRRPAMIYIAQVVSANSSGAHAISTHRVDLQPDGSAVFHTYDPNFPRDDSRRINWSPTTGFQTYLSGTTAGNSAFSYNYFRHVGFYVGLTPGQLASAKTDADQGFPASVFPKITVTSIRGKTLSDDVMASPMTTTQGQPGFKTGDRAIVIEGTVLGGNAQVSGQVVDNLNVIAPSGKLTASIDNTAGGGTGKFSVVVPVKPGVNQIALLAAKANGVSQWAAFKELLVESSAAPSNFTVTLSWGRGTSDVDLYVKEPDGVAGTPSAGKTGDIVYYAHRLGTSTTNAYLDFDNTSGYGPEHYIVRQGLLTKYSDGTNAAASHGLFRARVHYYAWHGDSSADRTVPWTVNWRYLTACRNGCLDPEVDGVWATGSRNGQLSQASPSGAGPSGFNAGGASWSEMWTIDVPLPQTSWTVPPSNTIMLP